MAKLGLFNWVDGIAGTGALVAQSSSVNGTGETLGAQYASRFITASPPRYMVLEPNSNSPSNDGLIVLTWLSSSLVLDMTDATPNGFTANSIEKIFTYSGGNVQVVGYPGDEYGASGFDDVYFYDILEQTSGVFAAEGYVVSDVTVS